MKTKKKVTQLLTDSEAVEAMRRYAENTSQLKKLEAEVELQIQTVRDRYKESIEGFRNDAKEASEQLTYYAEFNRKRLFKDGKTIDLQHGTISIRLGTPKVDKLRSLTWEAAVEKIKKIFPAFIRTKEEVDKESIIDSREDAKIMAKLKDIGVQVVQDEAITIKSKEEELIDS